MPDYMCGKIYCIRDRADGDKIVYVGSTTQSLSNRMSGHRSDVGKTGMKLHKRMGEVGTENFHIELIVDFPCDRKDQLLAEEGRHIRLHQPECNKVIAGRTQKEYNKTYVEANREAVDARKKAYRDANRTTLNAKQKMYDEANKEAVAAAKKKCYEARKEEILASSKVYREANKEAIAAQKKAFAKANKEALTAYQHEYYEANKARIATRNKAYVEAHKERTAAYQKEWYLRKKAESLIMSA